MVACVMANIRIGQVWEDSSGEWMHQKLSENGCKLG